jgi:flagellar biosynthesis anti-sigma factor FlgM
LLPINHLKASLTLGGAKEWGYWIHLIYKNYQEKAAIMEIPGNDFRIKNKIIQDRVKVGEKPSTSKSQGASSTAGEQIKISSRARDVQLANEVINTTPNVRASEVERVKAAIEKGYNVDSRDIAEGILKNLLQES